MKHLHISLFFSIYKQGYDSSDLGENPLFLLPKILGSFDAQNLNRLTVQKMGMLVSWQLRKLDCHLLQGLESELYGGNVWSHFLKSKYD